MQRNNFLLYFNECLHWIKLFSIKNFFSKETVARSCFVRKVFLKFLQNSQEKHLYQIKKQLQHRRFPMNFTTFLKTTVFKNTASASECDQTL